MSAILRSLGAWRRAVDETLAALPIIGGLLAPPWRIVPLGVDDLRSGVLPPSGVAGRGPVVVRLATGAGLWLELELPRAAAGDLESAVELALPAHSPIQPARAAFAADRSAVDVAGDRLHAPVALAEAATVAQAVRLVSAVGRRVSAVDVAMDASPDAPPSIDLITGGPALRPGPSPSLVALLVAGTLLLVGAAGLGFAFAPRTGPSLLAASPSAAAMRDLALAREQSPPLLAALNAVSAALPATAYLDRFEIAGREIKLAGRARDPAGLPARLDAAPELEGAAFSGSTRGLDDGFQAFEITCRFVPGDGR
ncbi:hypothetical protein GC169_04240 [bacterium]|nr:hypothetical protein [bacterium]